MNRKTTSLALVLTVAAVIGYNAMQSDPELPRAAPPTTAQEKTEANGTSQDTDPSISEELELTDVESFAEDEMEIVYGMKVKKNRNCDIKLHYIDNGDGTVKELVSCTPRSKPVRPFTEHDNETLAVLAYSDAEAAYALGERIILGQPKAGTQYLLRAVALDRDRINAINLVRYRRFPNHIGVENQRELAAGAYVYARLRAELDSGSQSNYSQSMFEYATQHYVDSGGTEQEMLELNARTEKLRQYMIRIQHEVLGESDIAQGGDL